MGNIKIKRIPSIDCAEQALQQWSPQSAMPLSEMVLICCKVILNNKAIHLQMLRVDKEN